MRPRRDVDFDLWMRFGERCEKGRFQKGADQNMSVLLYRGVSGPGYLLHASRASSPVTIVEIEAFALEDESPQPIL